MTHSEKSAAVVIGSSGGIGSALCNQLNLDKSFDKVVAIDRKSTPNIDLLNEDSIMNAAQELAASDIKIKLLIVATGFLHGLDQRPEKRLKDLSAASLSNSFAINTIGPALLLKHFLPLAPKGERSVFACLSARVGSIGDNSLGGWHSYRASKAALNQIIKTMAVELRRTNLDSVLVSIHPGTTSTELSKPFSKNGLDVRTPEVASKQILSVLGKLTTQDSGAFFDHLGKPIPW